MHILLLILQIILWIVLGLLALITLLLLIVLFVPIHYSADAVIHDDYTAIAAKVRFLIVSVKVKFDKGTKKLDTAIKILGIRLGEKDTKKGKVKKSKNKKIEKNDKIITEDAIESTIENTTEDLNEAEDINVSETQKDTIADNIIDITKTVQEGMEKIESDIEEDVLYDEPHIKLKETKKKEKKNKKREKKIKPSNNLNSGKNKLDAVNAKIEAVKTKYARFMKFWRMGCTVKTRKYLKKYFPQLLKHIGPRKIKGHVRYGFDEPATTGQITGYLSLLPFMYHKNFFPEPDFYNKVLEGEVSIRGRLQIGYIIRPAFKLHLWKTIKMARKI
ncbi:MAG: hypothetical protein HDT40_04725 [Lachnospiraceae bacterium]|nr:hypothetical protein [Lachnospiraceae bacterium]